MLRETASAHLSDHPETPTPKEHGHIERRLIQFSRQKFPLSVEGQRLLQRVKQALESHDSTVTQELALQLPTVEHPHTELFAELALSPAQVEEYFGQELANIQVTKGCSHDCGFCAIDAQKGVEVMPFAAIVKIGAIETEYDRQSEQDFQAWVYAVLDATGIDVNEFKFGLTKKQITAEQSRIMYDLYETYLSKYKARRFVWGNVQELKDGPAAAHYRLRIVQDIVNRRYSASLTNYYDSDPFDYRDVLFPHEDGTPADFGDVVKLLVKSGRPIHITTAGWRLNNSVAQRAAEKVIEMYKKDPSVLSVPRISINPTHALAEKDLVKYLEMMKNVIQTLKDCYPQILLFKEQNSESEYNKKVAVEIERFVAERVKPTLAVGYKTVEILSTTISNYSGRAIEYNASSDHDVMSCMPGYHIWPDGTVHRQGQFPKGIYTGTFIEKGSRPTEVPGVRLFEKRDT